MGVFLRSLSRAKSYKCSGFQSIGVSGLFKSQTPQSLFPILWFFWEQGPSRRQPQQRDFFTEIQRATHQHSCPWTGGIHSCTWSCVSHRFFSDHLYVQRASQNYFNPRNGWHYQLHLPESPHMQRQQWLPPRTSAPQGGDSLPSPRQHTAKYMLKMMGWRQGSRWIPVTR